MIQVNRNGHLKIPKQVHVYEKNLNFISETIAIQRAIATANDRKVKSQKIRMEAESIDKELEKVQKIPSNSNDLIVITVVKKLGAYVIAVTEKSPKKFRAVFVHRMQNYCLNTLELLLQANFIRMDSLNNKVKREEFQKEAIVQLKLLGYIAMISESVGCILMRQYKQISLQTAEAINLIAAWKKSDDERWRNRK